MFLSWKPAGKDGGRHAHDVRLCSDVIKKRRKTISRSGRFEVAASKQIGFKLYMSGCCDTAPCRFEVTLRLDAYFNLLMVKYVLVVLKLVKRLKT